MCLYRDTSHLKKASRTDGQTDRQTENNIPFSRGIMSKDRIIVFPLEIRQAIHQIKIHVHQAPTANPANGLAIHWIRITSEVFDFQ